MPRIQITTQHSLDRCTANYYRAKSDFERLDALSKVRALNDWESRQLESAIARMAEWGAVL